ncbi:MAG: hypothetical protein VX749_03455 [Pseudomonadota bacterium]|nr:hypothetical protein [Pseudomonadota bacterium]
MFTLKSKLVPALATGVALLLGTGPLMAADKVTWNMSLWGKPRAWTKGIEAMAEEVSSKSGGNFTIKVHYGGLSKP